MSRRMGRMLTAALAATLTAGLALSASAAVAAPGAKLKQFRVPTANSEPRDITNGSDGNRWFTEGTEFTGAPAKIGRITPAGVVTEFEPGLADGCNFCILTDIERGQGDLVYITSNDATLMRFNVQTQSFEAPVAMPNSGALGGSLAVHGDVVFITDFNNDVVWRYNTISGTFDSFAAATPPTSRSTRPATPGSPSRRPTRTSPPISRASTPSPARSPEPCSTPAARAITVSPADGKVWFAVRFPARC